VATRQAGLSQSQFTALLGFVALAARARCFDALAQVPVHLEQRAHLVTQRGQARVNANDPHGNWWAACSATRSWAASRAMAAGPFVNAAVMKPINAARAAGQAADPIAQANRLAEFDPGRGSCRRAAMQPSKVAPTQRAR
jgi:hypothetical protein